MDGWIMESIGVNFEIPNEYGKFLEELLIPIPCNNYKWLVDNDEIHVIKDNDSINEFLFKDEERIIGGETLESIAKRETYYMVFLNLWGYNKIGSTKQVHTGKEFLESDCEIILGVYDCSEVIFLCKDKQIVDNMYTHALSKEYSSIEYISKQDLIEGKYNIG